MGPMSGDGGDRVVVRSRTTFSAEVNRPKCTDGTPVADPLGEMPRRGQSPDRRQPSAHGLLPVDGLAEDVGVAGVLGGFSEDVREDAPCAPRRAWLEPGSLGQRLQCVEVDAMYQLVGGGRHVVVLREQTGEAFAIQ